MASGVKWIKIATDLFDDEKIIVISNMQNAHSILIIWFKLLTLAGKQNNDGVLMIGEHTPCSVEMLSILFREKKKTVQNAIDVFESMGMIEIIDGAIIIQNWNKHQTLDSYEKKKARDRIYQKERRRKQKEIASGNADCSYDKSSDVCFSEEEREEERDKDIEKYKKEPKHCEQCEFKEKCGKSINDHFEYAWKFYPEKSGKSGIKDSTKRELYKHSYSQIEKAINKYKDYVKSRSNDRFQMPYKNGDTFFRTYIKDYLEEETVVIENNEDNEWQ